MEGIAPVREGLGATERGRPGTKESPFFSGLSVLCGTEGVWSLCADSDGVKGDALTDSVIDAEGGIPDWNAPVREVSENPVDANGFAEAM